MNDQRYARQISLEAIGIKGQEKLATARVAIVGCGGLGAIAAAYLAGAGVGYLLLIDGDRPQLSNLHRQVFYDTGEVEDKATALADRLHKLNPDVDFKVAVNYLDRQNIAELLGDDARLDLVLECTDQAQVKHLVSDFCAIHEIPLVYGAIHKSQGYLALFANQQETDCHLRDLFPEPDDRLPTCAEVGVLNTAAGLIGLLQANEALKWLLSIGNSLNNRLLTYDCLRMEQQVIQLAKNFHGDLEDVFKRSDYSNGQSPLANRHSRQASDDFEISHATLADWPSDSYQLFSLLNEAQEPDLPGGAVRYQQGALKEGPDKKVFYCARGRQSKALAELLRRRGVEAYWTLRL
ncbi:hypothetical protein CEQ90_15750 [Lewinellaceae bacterium SD302]|nr:hypothetical protein CEQ90_15750 [Lewinellaceae bacterium SD302]